jgi:hypothetical protein
MNCRLNFVAGRPVKWKIAPNGPGIRGMSV